MKRLVVMLIVLLVAAATAAAVSAGNGDPIDTLSANALTLAVYGDSPYGTSVGDQTQVNATPAFINTINADSKVDLVLHVGDIHSGTGHCLASYDQTVAGLWQAFKDPLVYTPGDNEWTDCHHSPTDPRNPVERLGFLRAEFFFAPGTTLGIQPRRVLTQGRDADFAAFVENQAWMEEKTMFAVVNVPGSNNDLERWRNGVGSAAEQQQEFDTRLAADLAWLDRVFALAGENHARAVVLGMQADMWDPAAGTAGLTGYGEIVKRLASRVLEFGRPVLLLEGDSHDFKVDDPLAHGDPARGVRTPVPNLTRIVVEGGPDNFPLEYLRLTIDTRCRTAPFSWQRIRPVVAP
jgi:hypothetical protein